ncbi:MAG: single-stranded DNA-binding protein [Deltaproteobacteria bacterium]|nr:single-stranded DNA-binding protein [Deltaproteobacteria bacterium]
MASLNQCQFIGNLGKEVTTKYMPDGKAVSSFSIACSESWKDRNTGEKQQRTEWVNIVAFGKLAEIMGQYLHKGSKVFISGKMKTEKYTDRSGVEKYTTKIIANEMIMLDSRNQGALNQQASTAAQQQRPAQSAPAAAPPANNGFDDEIPFMSYEFRSVI